MWYEILPCIGIMTACLALPKYLIPLNQSLWQNGNPYRRDMCISFNRNQYLRDLELNGNSYKVQGLDFIPDE
ncbi:uncharacterized protein LOC111048500 [Nilaparvata lugens]|uniref:uncharacterized protein LOC111048500 n=1 Tax=Nilaparvata lugens TaxID=108931 RepID=UPI00193E4A67|nr:uncharacterized protein LOC111048500 [Nilaparvata lugens]